VDLEKLLRKTDWSKINFAALSDRTLDKYVAMIVFRQEPHFCSLCVPFEPPYYTTDLAASELLRTRMRELGWREMSTPQMDNNHVYFHRTRPKPQMAYASDPNFFRALAIAALSASVQTYSEAPHGV
jgi:hypothetical protein